MTALPRPTTPLISASDIAQGVEVFNRHPDLTSAARRVGIELVSHFNKRTGRCDPGEGRLAFAIKRDERTVRSAKDQLRKAGLISWRPYAGNYKTCSYEFNWPIIRELAATFKAELADYSQRIIIQDEPELFEQEPGQKLPVQPEENFRVTSPMNFPNKPSIQTVDQTSRSNTSQSSKFAAERQWNDDLNKIFQKDHARSAILIEHIDEEIQKRATNAEMRNQGDGVKLILNSIQKHLDEQAAPKASENV